MKNYTKAKIFARRGAMFALVEAQRDECIILSERKELISWLGQYFSDRDKYVNKWAHKPMLKK